jgi:DNA polymerase-3 subunit beta
LVREEGEVKLSIGQNQIAFELNRTLLVSKLIEGNYRNYRQVIPSEAKERITLERETFLTTVSGFDSVRGCTQNIPDAK